MSRGAGRCIACLLQWNSPTRARRSPDTAPASPRAPAAPALPPSALPGLDQPNLEPELIDDALDDEVDELADLFGSLIESWRRRHHDRARFGRQRHVAEMHE